MQSLERMSRVLIPEQREKDEHPQIRAKLGLLQETAKKPRFVSLAQYYFFFGMMHVSKIRL
jgi:hypothetical protein